MFACGREAVDSLIASTRFFAGDSGPQMPIDSAEWLDSEAACKAAPPWTRQGTGQDVGSVRNVEKRAAVTGEQWTGRC